MDNNKIRLTGLWQRETEDGRKYLSGSIGPNMKLMIWPNKYKESDNSPDFNIYLVQDVKDISEQTHRKDNDEEREQEELDVKKYRNPRYKRYEPNETDTHTFFE